MESRSESLRGGDSLLVAAALAAAVAVGWFAASIPEAFGLPRGGTDAGTAALLVGAVAACLLVGRPRFGLPLLVAFVYLNLSQVLVRTYEWPSLLRLFTLVLLVIAWRLERSLDRSPVPQWATGLLGLYALLVFVSSLWAEDLALADTRWQETVKGLVIYGLALSLAGSLDWLRRANATLIGCAALLAGMGIWQVSTSDFESDLFAGLARTKQAHIYGEVFEPRIAGPLGDPNYFAQILVLVLPIAVFAAWHQKTTVRRTVGWAAVAALIAGALLTYSRGGALALAVVFLLTLATLGRRRPLGLLASVGVALALTFALPSRFTERIFTVSQFFPGTTESAELDSSFEERKLFTTVAWQMFLERPLRGVGAGNYSAHFEEVSRRVGSPGRDYVGEGRAHYPHNLYLEIAAETGLLGVIVFSAAFLAILQSLAWARRRYRCAGLVEWADQATALQIGLVGFAISSLFLHGAFQRYLWLVFGLAVALVRLSPGGESGKVEVEAGGKL